MQAETNRLLNRLITLILLSYPALTLLVQGGSNGMFLVLLIVSFAILYRSRKSAPAWDKIDFVFAIAMLLPTAAIFLSQAYHAAFRAPSYDWAARFWLAIPIFLALRRVNTGTLAMLQLGAPIGALAGLALVLIHPFNWDNGRATTGQFLNLIHFSDIALSMGFLSLFAIGRVHRDYSPALFLKLAGFLAGAYLSIQSGERGAWLSIPFLLMLWIYMQSPVHKWRNAAIAGIAVCALAVTAYATIDIIHQRIDMIQHDLAAFSAGNKDTSIGVRLQLWQVAIHAFIQHPIFGLGPDGFANMMPRLAASGELTPHAAHLGQGEVHSELLAKCAGLGIFGLLAYLAIHFVPLWIFLRSLNDMQHPQAETAALMGAGLVIGFVVFGQTVEIYDLKMTAAFYALTIAILCATVTNRTQVKTI